MQKRIIIVDDDREVREIASFVLSRNSFSVELACNGEQMQKLLAVSLPDLIVLDVMMPGQNGYQLFCGLKSDPKTSEIPVIIMTAHSEDIYQQLSQDLGVERHITKPFHPFELVEKVKGLLSASS